MSRMLGPSSAWLVTAAIGAVLASAATPASEKINFGRDIRPILSDNCFRCHGPDDNQRKVGLRLDTREGLFAKREGVRVLVPGDPASSELFRRISATDPVDRMPPPESGKSLTTGQIEGIRRWIAQGADWERHWSFVPPKRPALPEVGDTSWPRNAIDYFVLARLEREGLRPSPQADRRTLIRRVTLDLTGLPPTLNEVEAFVQDDSPNAYEKVVDRLLESPHYGEHMARYWLDAARYGDTHGLHLDNYREMWPYRDWVIGAFNANQPYDQFVIEQLAGDLLPEATLERLIASGFNRCHVSTNEGGSIKEEVYVRNVVDRVETMGTVFLGLTTGCAVCHDHKFDPIAQKDFYRLFAFFNSLDGDAMDGNRKDPAPVVKVYSRDDRKKLARLTAEIERREAELRGPQPELDAAQAEWEEQLANELAEVWRVFEPDEFESVGGAVLEKLDDHSILASGENPATDTYRVLGRTDLTDIRAVRLEALTDDSLPKGGAGRTANANFVLSEIELEVRSVANPKRSHQVRFAAAYADHSQKDYDVAMAIDGKSATGWAVDGGNKREDRTALFVPAEPFGFEGGSELRFALRHESRHEQHVIGRFRFSLTATSDPVLAAQSSELGEWHSLGPFVADSFDEAHENAFGPEKTLDESGGAVDLSATYREDELKWMARPQWQDGRVRTLEGEYAATYLYRIIHAPSARRMSISLGSDDSLLVWLNGREVLNRKTIRGVEKDQEKLAIELQKGENHLLMKVCNGGGGYGFYFQTLTEESGEVPSAVARALEVPSERRDEKQKAVLRDFYRRHHWPRWEPLSAELASLRKQKQAIEEAVPTSLVFRERAEPRDAYVLKRGQYDQRGEKVTRGTPVILPPMDDNLPGNRLGLARWLVDPGHPLTARVAVNRFWQQCFGTGIVRTAEDFGSQGEPPSHPELLDYLATDFVGDGWDVKRLMKRIVMSATYRQSSRVTEELRTRDPDNRLLARGPRFRLDAEVLRDQALAVSGMLVREFGGASVKPPQPDGLWYAVGYTSSNTARFKQDSGEKIYRRSVYTFWKRTAPPPVMRTFDAPSREACQVRRERTNTPLQALVLMNETQFVEAARHLAERVLEEAGESPEQRIRFGFELVTARPPDDVEMAELLGVLEDHRREFAANPEAAKELIQGGDSAFDTSAQPPELAAWTMVANLLLNLDEVISKG